MKKIITLLLAFVCVHTISAQKTIGKNWPENEQKNLKSANILLENSFYKTAYAKYTELLKTHPEEIYLKYRLGVCGLYIEEKHEEALKHLSDVYEKDKKAMDIEYYLAVLYHRTYQFDKSIELASKLLANKKLNPKEKAGLEELVMHNRNGQILVKNPSEVKIENIGASINTEGSEYSPVITSDEEMLFYTYRGKECLGGLFDMNNNPDPDGDYNEDVFVAKKIDGKWQKPESVIEINTIENDAAIAISNDGQQLFLYKSTETDNGDIYVSHLNDGKFGPAERISGINSNSWEGSVTQSSDNRRIIFASERPGGFGGKDLYCAVKMPDNTWGNIKNLGASINTEKDEDAPFIHPDGRSLVFSSEGHNTMGGFDIYVSDLDEIDSTWKSPVNLGYPINSTNDDIFYIVSADGKRGYYSSIKKDGFGDHDIYTVEPAITSKKSYLTVIKGKMTENLFPIEDGEINVTVLNDNRKFGSFKPNPASGHYLVNLPSGYDYNINFYHPVFGDKNFKVMTSKTSDYTEKYINVNYGMSDTSSTDDQIIDFREPFPSKTPQFTATGSNTDEGTINLPATVAVQPSVNSESPKIISTNAVLNKTMDPAILSKYSGLRAKGLIYRIQVAAYRYPQNYNSAHLRNVCSVIQKGKLDGNISLIVADKEFDSINSACDFLVQVQKAGQLDAFVTAEFNGKRYYINDLPTLEVVNKLFLATN